MEPISSLAIVNTGIALANTVIEGTKTYLSTWHDKRTGITGRKNLERERMIKANETLQKNRLAYDAHKTAWVEQKALERLTRQIGSQRYEGEQDRQLARQLAELSTKAQRYENELNRSLQRDLAEMSIAAQQQEGLLNRGQARNLAQLNNQLQRWVVEQQRALQREMQQLDAELARELREIDRQNAISFLHAQQQASELPVCRAALTILHDDSSDVVPLQIFFSPPNTRFDRTSNPTDPIKQFTYLENELSRKVIGRGIRQMAREYNAAGRPVEYHGGGWKSTLGLPSHEAGARAVFHELRSEAVAILESDLIGDTLDLHCAFWSPAWASYHFDTVMSFSWSELLYLFAKQRSLKWERRQEGKSDEEILNRYGREIVEQHRENIATWHREQAALADGEDPTEIWRVHHPTSKDYKALGEFIAACHKLALGLWADEYFLCYVSPEQRKPPLLPQFLSKLFVAMPSKVQASFVEMVIAHYEALYQKIAEQEAGWVPELRLDFAMSLAALPDAEYALTQLEASLQAWLAQRNVTVENGAILDHLIEKMSIGLQTPNDFVYANQLNRCLDVIYGQEQLG